MNSFVIFAPKIFRRLPAVGNPAKIAKPSVEAFEFGSKFSLTGKNAGTRHLVFCVREQHETRRRCARAPKILEEHRGTLENYELVFNRKARGGVATANIRQAPGKVVEGVLYRIPESAFRNLDRYEGAPQQYRRIEVTVTYGEGKKAGAQVYIATKVDKGLRPAPHYLQTILDGAAEHKISRGVRREN